MLQTYSQTYLNIISSEELNASNIHKRILANFLLKFHNKDVPISATKVTHAGIDS